LTAARSVLRGYGSSSAGRAASGALICYRAGKLKRAARGIRSLVGAAAFQANGPALMIATDALIARAVATRDSAPARRFILSMPGLKRQGATLAVVKDNYAQVVQLATLEHLAGDPTRGDGLARGILEFLDHGRTFAVAGADDWARATAEALFGRKAAALSSLEKVHQGNRIGWWDTIEGNPAFQELRASARFRSIAAGDRIWLQGQRQALGQMRLMGAVPIRSGGASMPAGC
jgi:hypothetical protein